MPYTPSQSLFYAALAADALYSQALRHAYGSAAGDMRYQADLPDHLKALARAKIAADGRYLTQLQHEREAARRTA